MVKYFRNKVNLLAVMVCFSLVTAFFFWKVFFTNEPPVEVKTDAKWITSPVNTNYCFFKKDIYVDTPVSQAWIIFQAFDHITVSINDKEVFTQKSYQGLLIKGISVITHELSPGKNTIIVDAINTVFDKRPEILMEIGYLDRNGQTHLFFTDDSWKVEAYDYKRKNLFLDTGEKYWLKADIVEKPTDLFLPYDKDIFSHPLTTFFLSNPNTTLRFYVREKSRYAWLRFNAPGNYKIYVNGNIAIEEEYENLLKPGVVNKLNVYRIDRFMRRGLNEIKFKSFPPYVGKAEIFLDGVAYWGNEVIKLNHSLNTSPGVIPASSGEEEVTITFQERAPYTYKEYLKYAAVFLIILSLCFAAVLSFKDDESLMGYFLMSLGLIVFFISLNYDSRVSPGYFYRMDFGLLSLIIPIFIVKVRSFAIPYPPLQFNTEKAILFVITVLGFLIRLVYFNYETLQGDESALVVKAQGIYEYYYPSFKIADYLPTWYVTTSELISYIQALFLKIFKEIETAIRMHGLLSGTLGILLIYKLAERMSNKKVAFLSAAIFAFLPSIVGMTSYGRYPLLLLLMMLTCIHFLQLYLEKGLRKFLILSAIFFLLGYFSWQGSCFFLAPVALNMIYFKREKFLKDTLIYQAIVLIPISIHLSFRFYLYITHEFIMYGSNAASIAPTFAFTKAFFMPFYYFNSFLLASYHQFLFYLFCAGLGIQCYRLLRRQPFSMNLLFLQMYVLATTFCMTFFLEISDYRYAFYLIPYLIISSCMVMDMMSDLCGKYKNRCFLFLSLILFLLSTDLIVKLDNFPHTTQQIKSNYDVISYSRLANAVPTLRLYISPNDIVVGMTPHLTWAYKVYQVKDDLYFETILLLPVLSAPENATPLHRVVPRKTIVTIEELLKMKSTGNQVWIILSPLMMGSINSKDLHFINSHFKLFYEDINTKVYSSY